MKTIEEFRKAVHAKRSKIDSSILDVCSSKLNVLIEILNQCCEIKEKVVVFSTYVEVLDLVERTIEKSMQKPMKIYRLDGKKSEKERANSITEFNDINNTNTCIFLISAKAGGQGVNLYGASRAILLDVNWNPSLDRKFQKI